MKKKKAPKVHCEFTKMVEVDTLVPNPRNPNKHPKKQVEMIAKVIDNQGWRAPITVSKRSGFIVRGHGRLEAAQLLELKKVPVDYQDYENEASEWADLVADNKIAELANIDDDLMAEILKDLEGLPEIDLTGFTNLEKKLDNAIKINEIKIKKPPELTWILISIPTVKFGKINSQIEKISKEESVNVETTITNKEIK